MDKKDIMLCNYSEEQKVKEEKAYYSIFSSSHIPMLLISSADGQIRDANQAACSFYGYSYENMLRLKITDINILSQKEVFEVIEMAKNQDRNYYRFSHRLSNGDIRDVEVYIKPVTFAGESMLFSIIHDIQYKKYIEHKFRLQESLFRGLFENSPEAVAIVDKDFKIMDINKSFERIFLYKIEEIKGKNITKVLCDEKFYDESSYIKDCVKRGEFVRRETVRMDRNGRPIDVSFLSFPIILNGENVGIYCIYSDLTRVIEERRIHEKQIQRYLNLLKDTVDSISDFISVIRPDLTVELVNEPGCEFYNISRETMRGIYWNTLIKNKTGKDDYNIKTVVQTKKPLHIQDYLPEMDMFIDCFYNPIFDENGELMFIVNRISDITDKIKYEENLKSAKEKAEAASKYKTQFVAHMSHEIRTPMNGIVGIVDLLKETKLSDRQVEYIDMLDYSANRLSSIIDDILDVSKIEAGKLEIVKSEFHIYDLLSDIADYFRLQAGRKGLDFITSVDSDLPPVLIGDKERLNQVLFNLIGNAVKFTDKGYIGMNVKMLERSRESVKIEFSILDTGIGIPPEKLDSLFINFSQIDSSSSKKVGGTGLGLALSKKLVNLMGGDICVISEYGSKSRFTFTIEFIIPEAGDGKCHGISNCNSDREIKFPHKLNVLVAEDEIISAKIIKSMLEKNNCAVTIASNGNELIKVLNDQSFDILLMDLHMPEMDGYEAAEIIRQKEAINGGHMPIIAITAAPIKEDKEYCLKIGIDDYISKPLRKYELYSAILNALK